MKWYEHLAKFLEKRGRYREIERTIYTPEGLAVSTPYLDRWYIIRTKRFGLYLHRFWSSDEDGVHDHPWNNFSWVLHGGYWELLPDGQKLWRKPGFKKYRHAEEFHRIELENGTLAMSFYLPNTTDALFEFQALTHGGWVLTGMIPLLYFDSRKECVQHVEKHYEVEEL